MGISDDLTAEQPRKRGRPRKPRVEHYTRYDPSLCAEVLRMMYDGKTEKECARALGIRWSDWLHWKRTHPEFRDAVENGKHLCEAWWVEVGRKALTGKVQTFRLGVWSFVMKNLFGWKEPKDEPATTEDVARERERIIEELDARLTRLAQSGRAEGAAQQPKH